MFCLICRSSCFSHSSCFYSRGSYLDLWVIYRILRGCGKINLVTFQRRAIVHCAKPMRICSGDPRKNRRVDEIKIQKKAPDFML